MSECIYCNAPMDGTGDSGSVCQVCLVAYPHLSFVHSPRCAELERQLQESKDEMRIVRGVAEGGAWPEGAQLFGSASEEARKTEKAILKLYSDRAELERENAELKKQLAEAEQISELHRQREMECIKRWQAENKAPHLQPDYGRLLDWLYEKVIAQEKQLAEERESYQALNRVHYDDHGLQAQEIVNLKAQLEHLQKEYAMSCAIGKSQLGKAREAIHLLLEELDLLSAVPNLHLSNPNKNSAYMAGKSALSELEKARE